MSVTQKEIVEALRYVTAVNGNPYYSNLADRIEREGIAPPEGMVLVSDKPIGRILVWKGGHVYYPAFKKLTLRSYEEFPESSAEHKESPWENGALVYAAKESP